MGLMGQRNVEQPWTVVAADVMGPLPPSRSQFRYIVVFQDLFTRWIEVKALRAANGKAIMSAFEDLVVFRWGAPRYLLTDNGTEFVNDHVTKTLESYGIRQTNVPPYHPQANPVERTNRVLKTMISTFLQEDHRDWDLHLHEFRHAVNTGWQASTRVSPAFLNFGRQPRPVKSLRSELERDRELEQGNAETWTIRVQRLNALRDLVIRHNALAQAKQKKYYDRGRRQVQFAIGDLVLRRSRVLSSAAQNFAAKLAPRYDGPYTIVAVLSPVVYDLESVDGRRVPRVHVTDLKRYVPPRNKP